MQKPNEFTRTMERKMSQYIEKTLKDIKVEAADEFDKNFNREAFFTEKWTRRKYNDDESRSLLVQSGTLRRSIKAEVKGRESVVFSSNVKYAQIHNEGGTIKVTKRMKKYFWWKYITIAGSKRRKNGTTYSERFSRKKNGELRNNRRNRELTAEAEFYRRMALKKTGSKITIPKRQFIGNHPDLEKLLKEIAENNIMEIFGRE